MISGDELILSWSNGWIWSLLAVLNNFNNWILAPLILLKATESENLGLTWYSLSFPLRPVVMKSKQRFRIFPLFAFMLSAVLFALLFPPSLFKGFPGSSDCISISKPAVDCGRQADSHMEGWGISQTRPLPHDWTHTLTLVNEMCVRAHVHACVHVCVGTRVKSAFETRRTREVQTTKTHIPFLTSTNSQKWITNIYTSAVTEQKHTHRHTYNALSLLPVPLLPNWLIGDLIVNSLYTLCLSVCLSVSLSLSLSLPLTQFICFNLLLPPLLMSFLLLSSSTPPPISSVGRTLRCDLSEIYSSHFAFLKQ